MDDKSLEGSESLPLAPVLPGEGAGEGVSSRETYRVEVADDDSVGVHKPSFGVWDPHENAVCFHKLTCLAEMAAGHVGKQMVFDLVVEPTHEECHEPASRDIAGREHLPAQEVGTTVFGKNGHPFVVWRKGAAHVQPENGHLNRDKCRSDARGESNEQKSNVGAKAQTQ
ncbi:hypothetical protein J2Y68_000486 [Paenarthrobacter nitroguajacolicus]|nr:hypothetical protein [Paenarthrobacter nitroguajacolicus]